MLRLPLFFALAVGLASLLAACDEGSDVRTVRISVGDGGCTPAQLGATPGQRLRLAIQNDSDNAFTVSSSDGGFAEVHIEPDGDAETFFTVPDRSGEYVLVCEGAGRPPTEILIVAGTAADLTPVANPTSEPGMPQTLAVTLVEFSVSVSDTALTTGSYNLIATNVSDTMAHELNVLKLQADGSYSPIASIPPIAPGQGGSVLVNLTPGGYRFACQIQSSEAGSEVDHYLQGMFIDLNVE